MRVLVSTAREDCVASRALGQEDVAHEVVLQTDLCGYGRLFTDLWNAGEPFVLLEDDIAPWPGAVRGLIDCPEPWCVHESVVYPGNLLYAIACGKYRPQEPAPESWAKEPWMTLEQPVCAYLSELHGAPHVHRPPVAHVRAELIRAF